MFDDGVANSHAFCIQKIIQPLNIFIIPICNSFCILRIMLIISVTLHMLNSVQLILEGGINN